MHPYNGPETTATALLPPKVSLCSHTSTTVIAWSASKLDIRPVRAYEPEMVVPKSRLVTKGDRASAVRAPRLWTSLPENL